MLNNKHLWFIKNDFLSSHVMSANVYRIINVQMDQSLLMVLVYWIFDLVKKMVKVKLIHVLDYSIPVVL